jgi:hypothetical protein
VAEEHDEAWKIADKIDFGSGSNLPILIRVARGAAAIRAYRDQAVAETKTRAETAEGVIESLKTESGLAALVTSRGWPLPEELAAAKERIKELEAKLASAHRLLRASGAAADAAEAKVKELERVRERVPPSSSAEASVAPEEQRVPRGFIEVHQEDGSPACLCLAGLIVQPEKAHSGCWIAYRTGATAVYHRESYEEVLEKIREAKR